MKTFFDRAGPVLSVVLGILIFWYIAAILLNAPWAQDKAKRAGVQLSTYELVADTMSQKKPLLPVPHQVGAELWKTTGEIALEGRPFSKRSLLYHSWVTFSATFVGFILGTGLGIFLAIGIVHNYTIDKSIMPWVVASQTIPILAIAPMIIVVLNALGVAGLLPKAVISMYLSFFPVVVGMVKGLRSPDHMQFDLMKTWSASSTQTFWKLRLPSSAPYLFTSMKIAMAASLVGAIVGELPTGAIAGLGARLLGGSYYGQTIQIWSALIAAATLAACLVGTIGLIQTRVLKKMGMAQ